MRKLNLLPVLFLLATGFVLQSCSKGSSGGGGTTPTPTPNDKKLTVTLSSNQINADGFDEAKVTVKDENGNDVTANCSIFVNNLGRQVPSFWTENAGTYKVKAQKGSLLSPEVTLTAVAPGPSPFTQKLLVEDFTGTWCQYCPRVGLALENYSSAHPNCIVVANHGGNGTADPYLFQYHSTMANYFQIQGYPSAVVNRNGIWDEGYASLNGQLLLRAPVGLSVNTSISGSTINVDAKVKFDVTTGIDLRLAVYLVEDSLVYPQVNSPANGNGLSNPISNYVHNAVLRKTASDIYGDLIDKTSQQKGSTYQKNFSFNVSGLNYNMNNLRVIAFVAYGTGNYLSKKGTANVQSVKAGQNKDFD
ncbi:MAG: Omp28-related outer membrane protein [Terrimonas sp.]|nr:Omp28-related outer membrane protein [Terrimonas sp.]